MNLLYFIFRLWQKTFVKKNTKKIITAEMFEAATGAPPEDDDLERCNCEKAGEPLHWSCGWCEVHNMPIFMDPECFSTCMGRKR